ncbi:MAG TPA: hypothetical protein VIR98_00030 [Candidatus Paceibacterota bacterium]|jgi:hypothetical protein
MKHLLIEHSTVFRDRLFAVNEFQTGNPDINIAITKISTRYPINEGTWAVNDKSTMVVIVAEGHGKIVVEDNETPIRKFSMIEIPAGEKYIWKSDGGPFMPLVLIIASHPAWIPEQHRTIG